MDSPEKRIAALEDEIKRLKAELESSKEREREFEDTRRAMLFLLEDLNESAAGMAKAKAEWEATFDSISDLVFVHDHEMRVIRCNRAYEKAAGLPFNEIIGRPYHEAFPKMDGPFDACLKNEGINEEDVFIPSVNRIYKVRFYALKVNESKENFFIHVMEDITEAKRAAEKEKLLYNFTQKITSSLDLNFRLKTVCDTVLEAGYIMAWVGFLDEDTKEIVPMAMAGAEEGYLSEVKIKYDDSPLGNGPSGRAVKSGKAEVQDRLTENGRFEPWKEAALKRGYGSVASFPVIEEGKPFAILSIYNIGQKFPEKDIDFFQTLANQAASYIKNARLFGEIKTSSERITEEMELTKHLLMIAYATAHTTDLERLMEEVAHCVKIITKATACLSYMWDREERILKPSQAEGLAYDMLPSFRVEKLDLSLPLLSNVFSERSAAVRDCGPDLPDQNPSLERPCSILFEWVTGINTMVLIPLVGKENNLGLIVCLYLDKDKGFASGITERDREVLDGISYLVSTALEEARLYKDSIDHTIELSRKVQTIQTMGEIDRSILSTLEPQVILETATRMVSRIVFCERATVALVDKERGGFIYTAGFGITSLQKGGFIDFAGTNSSDVVKTGRAQYTADMRELIDPPLLERQFVKEGFLSQIRVPLLVKGEVVGVLSVGARRPSAYTADDLAILEKLACQISVAFQNAKLITDLGELFMGTVKALSQGIDAKSPWTGGHSERVTAIAVDIARNLGLKEQEIKDIELAGLLHDIGKLGTYETILDKPGRLTDEEIGIIRKHPNKGADILSSIKQMKKIIPGIKHHHEYYDGSGYPDKLKGESIPLMARILAVADTVDAMGADRPYRKGKPMEAIIAELKRCSGTQFDTKVVEAFLRSLRERELFEEKAVKAN